MYKRRESASKLCQNKKNVHIVTNTEKIINNKITSKNRVAVFFSISLEDYPSPVIQDLSRFHTTYMLQSCGVGGKTQPQLPASVVLL